MRILCWEGRWPCVMVRGKVRSERSGRTHIGMRRCSLATDLAGDRVRAPDEKRTNR
jgi:hypothetical protein